MRRILYSSIPVGVPVPANLYTGDGRIFLRAGRTVLERHLSVGRVLFKAGLFVDDQWPLEPYAVEPSSKQDGASAPIFHDRWVLRGRGEITVESPTTTRLDEAICHGDFAAEMPTAAARSIVDPPFCLAELREQLVVGRQRLQTSVDQYAEVAGDIVEQRITDLGPGRDNLDQTMDLIGTDRSLGLLAMELKQTPEEYLYHHGVNVATLTMTMARHLGFRPAQAMEAGIGAMFHDAGMLKVPVSVRLADRPLTTDEWLEVKQHPIHTVNALESIRSVSLTTLMVAYQIHERCDGSGYPRGRTRPAIHPLARVAAVADTYVAWCSWRPHRAALTPYRSIVKLLAEIREQRFDPDIVRALLDCVALCPVGSYVKLSNGQTARVMRSNGTQHTRPIVVPLREDGAESDQVFDLARDEWIRIVAAVEGPPNAKAA